MYYQIILADTITPFIYESPLFRTLQLSAVLPSHVVALGLVRT